MHQEVHSAVLDKERESTIFTTLCTFGFQKQNKQPKTKKNVSNSFFLFSLFIIIWPLLGFQNKNESNGKCFFTDSCNTQLSLLPMPLKKYILFLISLFAPLKLWVMSVFFCTVHQVFRPLQVSHVMLQIHFVKLKYNIDIQYSKTKGF